MKKHKDQHMMESEEHLKKVVKTAELSEEDKVLEIGGGTGNLTEKIAEKAGEVLTVEKDPELIPELKSKLDRFNNIKIRNEDAMNTKIKGYNKIVSNLPYQLTQPILRKLEGKKFDLTVLTVPENFSKRLRAEKDSKEYSSLSIRAPVYFKIKKIDEVPRESFEPEPKVDSEIIKIKPRDEEEIKENKNLFIKRYLFDSDQKIKNYLRDLFWNNGKKITGKEYNKKEAKEKARDILKEVQEDLSEKRPSNLSKKELEKLFEEIKREIK